MATTAELEQRIADLEAIVGQLTGSEALEPNYLTLQPDGSVGADFTGHVHAQGLDLDEGTVANPPADRKVRWLDAGGVSREELFGFFTANAHFAKLWLPDSGAGVNVSHDTVSGVDLFEVSLNSVPILFTIDNTRYQFLDPAAAATQPVLLIDGLGLYVDWLDGALRYNDNVGAQKAILDVASISGFPLARWGTNLAAHNAKLRAFSNGQNSVPADAYCDVSVDGVFRTLINRGAESAFLQLAAGKRDSQVEVNYGTDTIGTNAVNSATKNIAHGLHTTPIVVFVICSNNNANVVCQSGAYGATNFTAQVAHRDAATNFGAGTTQSIAWLAIG